MVAEWSSWDWGLGACSSTDKVDRVKRRYPMTSLHRAPHSPHSTYPKGKLAVQVSDLLVKKALADLRMIPTSSC